MSSARDRAVAQVAGALAMAVRRQAPLVALITAFCAVLAVVAHIAVRPTYTAIAEIVTARPALQPADAGRTPQDLLVAERAQLKSFADAVAAAMAQPAVREALPVPVCAGETLWFVARDCGVLWVQRGPDPRRLQIVARASQAERAEHLAAAAAQAALSFARERHALGVASLRASHLDDLSRAKRELENNARAMRPGTPADALTPEVAGLRLRVLNRLGGDKDVALWAALFGDDVTPDRALEARLAWGELAQSAMPSPTIDEAYTREEAAFEQAFSVILRMAPDDPAVRGAVVPGRAPQTPDQPAFARLFLWAFALGAGLGVTIGVLRELRRKVVVRLGDVEARLGAPLLAPVPMVSAGDLRLLDPSLRTPAGAVVETPQSLIAAGMRSAYERLNQWEEQGGRGRAVAIIGDRHDTGASTLAASLGRTTAQAGRRVILVDADVRDHGAMVALGHLPKRATAQIKDWRSQIVPDNETRLDILPLPARPGLLPFAFPDVDFGALAEELTAHYDLVVIDCPPALVRSDGLIAARAADVVILAAQWNRTQVSEARAVRSQLARFGAQAPQWVLLNRTDGPEARAWFARSDERKTQAGVASG